MQNAKERTNSYEDAQHRSNQFRPGLSSNVVIVVVHMIPVSTSFHLFRPHKQYIKYRCLLHISQQAHHVALIIAEGPKTFGCICDKWPNSMFVLNRGLCIVRFNSVV